MTETIPIKKQIGIYALVRNIKARIWLYRARRAYRQRLRQG
jgi:hypothetical protein